jgi:ribonucleoside-diphosphate reductase alpha chain
MGHIRMMASVQPFISGAISKTINMPGDASVQDIRDVYFSAWKSGLKAVALYRDGCKHSQPLASNNETKGASRKLGAAPTAVVGSEAPASASPDACQEAAPGPAVPVSPDRRGNGGQASAGEDEIAGAASAVEEGNMQAAGPGATAPPPSAEQVLKRRRLPKKRGGFTQESRVGGNKVYLRTGQYPDGRLGEIFVDMHKEGAAFRSMMNCFAIAVSLGLQHGVPLEEYVDAFVFTRFDPQGPVDHPNIKYATSVIDYIFRVLGLEYLGRTDFVQVKPADQDDGEERVIEVLAQGPGAAAGARATREATGAAAAEGGLSRQARSFMSDAPFCETCGHLTVRNGACYKCLNCGSSMGCS